MVAGRDSEDVEGPGQRQSPRGVGHHAAADHRARAAERQEAMVFGPEQELPGQAGEPRNASIVVIELDSEA